MRFKYYLRGIGLGILFSVLIMAVSIHFHKNEIVSDEEVIKRAAQLGMVMAETETEAETETVTETETENNAASEVDSERPLDDVIPSVEETSTEFIPASEGVEDFADKDYVIITVESGDVPRDVCDKLQAYNIIEDSNDFRHYIGKKKGIVLMVGEYKIPKDATYDDIIKIIFKK